VILIPAAASDKLPEGMVIANGETKTPAWLIAPSEWIGCK